ncbi:MAG TPA: hypothetical protein VMZ28_12085 [Kofleriaceae bacterium]|nr:hypothetical protein [Kofleriaceae bacterium]
MARRNWLLGLGAVLVIAVPLGVALKQDLESEPPARAEPRPAPPAPVLVPEADAPATPAARHMPPDFFRDVIGTGKPKPALVGPLFRVRWGVTRAELGRIAPELFTWHHPDVLIKPLLEKGKVSGVSIEFPDDGTALTTLRAAWGETWRSADETLEVALTSPEPGKARVVVSPAAR